ncbi:helix-turn-helix domain-containing protein [Hymenobacter elongatus]|uniref:Helix-turn-helix domain-containing protein n=1 Tax=Hymenobacter elongatus TaxID=877208 RepID=A0A4Z0PLR6_9BACT|nr:helix-turn-helix domain-containing protein [Hymenobacter elongatus]
MADSIYRHRQLLRLSQAELAELAGVSHSFVTKLEAGKANPGLKQLNQLLDVLGLSLSIVPKI